MVSVKQKYQLDESLLRCDQAELAADKGQLLMLGDERLDRVRVKPAGMRPCCSQADGSAARSGSERTAPRSRPMRSSTAGSGSALVAAQTGSARSRPSYWSGTQ